MPHSIFPPLPFRLPPISFPFHNLQIESLPIRLNHEYYNDLFENDFLCLIPECFGILTVFIIILYGVVFSNHNSGDKQFDIVSTSLFAEKNDPRFQSRPNLRSVMGYKSSICDGLRPKTVSEAERNSESSSLLLDDKNTPKYLLSKQKMEDISEKQDFGGILGVNSSWIAILSIGFTILLLCNNPISNASVLYSCFLLDDFGVFLKILVVAGTFFSIVISLQYLQQEKLNNFELQTIILISSIMMLFLISSVDFISIYLAIECQSLCFYVMAGLKRENEFSTEAGLKYFLLGAFSSGILLFGFALQYGFTGTTNFAELSKIFVSIHDAWNPSYIGIEQGSESSLNHLFFAGNPSTQLFGEGIAEGQVTASATRRGCELGMIFILVAFLFKISAVPFHMWAPDVYEGAPTSVTAFFAIVPKVSILAICVRLCYGASYGFILSWQKILILSSILSMVLGAFAALSQNKIKRLLAWSSIGHVGFLLTALSCGSIEGTQALVFYLVIYVIMTIALFQIILLPLRREKINLFFVSAPSLTFQSTAKRIASLKQENVFSYHDVEKQKNTSKQAFDRDESDNQAIKYTTDLAFLSETYPIIAITIMITMFSIAGIPPLAGFWSKAFLLFAAMSAKQFALAMIVILTSVITCFYYIRIVKIMYFEAELSKWKTAFKERFQTSVLTFMYISKESCLVWGITVAILSFFCFNATVLFKATHLISLSFS